MSDRFAGASDRRLATLLGAALFVVGAWPLLLLHLPPYQDLPDHLSTVCVLLQPERYPELAPTGFFKANSLFLLVTFILAKVVGVVGAGRLVAVATVAATAFALPHFVLAFTDRRRMLVGSLFLAPMVHNWWVLMGMLAYAAAFPIALVLLVLLARQSARPSASRAVAIAAVGALLWYTHAVALLLVCALAAVDVFVAPQAKLARASRFFLPLLPTLLLELVTVAQHAFGAHDARNGAVAATNYQDSLSAIYDLWAHWQFGLSPRSAAGIVPAVALAVFAFRARRERVPLFSGWAFALLFALYWLLPYEMPGFGYVGERTLPFLWAWAIVRAPASVPRWLAVVLLASSALWSAGTGWDLLRAEADLDAFTAAAPEVPDVPAGARLLTLNFAPRVSSTNTWSLLHASGMYTVLRGAHPQDLWADSPSMPLRRVAEPSLVEDPVRVRDLLTAAGTKEKYCASLRRAALSDDACEARYLEMWRGVWGSIQVRYDEVLLWGAPPEFLQTVPSSFVPRVERDRLRLLAKRP